MILLLTTRASSHTDLVTARLNAMGAEYLRFDTDTVPAQARMHASFTDGRLDGWLTDGTRRVSFPEIRAIWWHAVGVAEISAKTDVLFRDWVQGELASAIATIACALPAARFPDPDRVAAAGRKWKQLAVATRCGFRCPASLITSSANELTRFSQGRPTVFKTLSHPEVRVAGEPSRQVYTTLLSTKDIERAHLLEHSIGFFQEYVSKVRDVRVTVVGDRVFAVAIESQESQLASVDWRRYDLANTPHHVIELDEATKHKCRRVLRCLELEYGAFDFAEDANGRLWFLEVNPNGLWAWLEILTGVPISEAIAEHLVGLAAG